MKLFQIIAADIARNSNQWTYEEHYLQRYLRGAPGFSSIKLTFFCNKPYVLLLGKVSLEAGWIDRIRLRKAGKKWLQDQFDGIQDALDESLPIDKWMEKRENEIQQRKQS